MLAAVVSVSVATLWKHPGAARALDAPALSNPADPAAWSRNLGTTAERVWLDSHVQTQALYGEQVAVLARRGAWTKVAVLDQPDPQDAHGYPGWLPTKQLSFAPFDASGDGASGTASKPASRTTGTTTRPSPSRTLLGSLTRPA